jgi:hypothetical protein
MVKNEANRQQLLFTKTWRHSKLASRFCKICWEKHHRAFVKVVEVVRSTTLLFTARSTSVQILRVKRGQSSMNHNVSRWNATPRPLLSARARRTPYIAVRLLKRARARQSVLSARATSSPATCRAPLHLSAAHRVNRQSVAALSLREHAGRGLAVVRTALMPDDP